MICPRCQLPLTRAEPLDGGRLDCPQCDGSSVPLAAALAHLPAREAEDLAQRARAGSEARGRTRCPNCLAKTTQLKLGESDQALRVDACAKCDLLWLDKGEWRALVGDAPSAPSDEQSRRVQAQLLLERDRAKAEVTDVNAPPHGVSANAIGLLGLPATRGAPTALGPALLVVMLCIALFTLWGLVNSNLTAELGFKPTEPLRLSGLTLVCSALVHMGVFHALLNVYFAWVFGRPVEKVTGSIGFALLFMASHLLGLAAHWLAHRGSHVAIVGAGGSISAMLVFHALALPNTRVQLFFFRARRWLTMPVRVALVMWLLAQAGGACMEAAGVGSVAYVANLAGGLVGVLGWWWRDSHKRSAPA